MECLPVLEVMGVSVFDPLWARRWHRDPQAELLCVVRGRMTLETERRRMRMGVGDFAFVPPNTAHRDLFPASESPEIFLARYSWPAHEAFFEQVTWERIARLPEDARSETMRAILQLRDHTASESALAATLARAQLHALLLRLWHAIADRTGGTDGVSSRNRQRELMEHARQYLDAHYHEPLTLPGIAERLHVSPYYLSRVFSRESGFSLTSYLTSVRMDKARELLRLGTGNVSEAAYATGYENVAHFSRVFKRHFGVSPGSVMRECAPRRS